MACKTSELNQIGFQDAYVFFCKFQVSNYLSLEMLVKFHH